VSPGLLLPDRFGHKERDRFKSDLGAQFLPSAGPNAIGRHFLISDDTARNMPPGTEELVVAPCEQGAPKFVLDEEINVDQGRDTAGKKENLLREAAAGIAD
jgi:hypothetical protein